MKKLISTTLLLVIFYAAQSTEQPLRMRPADRIIVDLFTDTWANTPDGMEMKTINRGMSVNLFYDMPIGRTNFSLAAGGGISSHNIYSDHLYAYHPLSGQYEFMEITGDYDKNKLSLNYFDIPLQFRYRSRNLPHVFRVYAGIKAGYLFNAHTKYKGQIKVPPPAYSSSSHFLDKEVKNKELSLGEIEKFRAGLTLMLGYGQANLHLYVPFLSVFRDNNASEMEAISIGLSVIIF